MPSVTTINGPRYVEQSSDKLKMPMHIHICTIFILNCAPGQQLNIVTNFLVESKVKALGWPGNSRKLNPIENLWTEMKEKIAGKQPSSVKDLIRVVKKVWVKELSKECCKDLIHSMPRRVDGYYFK